MAFSTAPDQETSLLRNILAQLDAMQDNTTALEGAVPLLLCSPQGRYRAVLQMGQRSRRSEEGIKIKNQLDSAPTCLTRGGALETLQHSLERMAYDKYTNDEEHREARQPPGPGTFGYRETRSTDARPCRRDAPPPVPGPQTCCSEMPRRQPRCGRWASGRPFEWSDMEYAPITRDGCGNERVGQWWRSEGRNSIWYDRAL